jgi:hypothetical protein
MERTRQSIAGILSFVSGLISLACIGLFFYYVVGAAQRNGPEAFDPAEMQLWTGVLLIGLIGGAVLAVALGLVGLMRRQRGRVLAALGIGMGVCC